ncbi:MAG: transposase family protein [Spirochaetaceae bacterium]|nr:transposase family protein [Spirochaetaceae bacterium]
MGSAEQTPQRIKDERRQSGHFLYKLIDVLVIGLTTILAGWDEFNGTEDFGKAKEVFSGAFWNCRTGYRRKRPLRGYFRG